MTIIGPGADNITVSGNNAGRIFNISDEVTISGLTLRDGNVNGSGGAITTTDSLTLTAMAVISNIATADGGGIAGFGRLIVNSSVISGNTANGADLGGGGIFAAGPTTIISGTTISHNRATVDDGGGIATDWRLSSPSAITLTNSLVTGNYAYDDGGGLKLDTTVAHFISTTIATNTADSAGGGIHMDLEADAILVDSAVSGNTADNGGGIYNDDTPDKPDGALTLINTLFYSNTATVDGGAIYDDKDTTTTTTSGDSDLLITGSRFIQNVGGDDGGGIYNAGLGAVIITDTAFISNTAAGDDRGAVYALGNVTVSDSLFQGNIAADDAGAMEVMGALVITNTDFIGNQASGSGGLAGAILGRAEVSLTDSLMQGNHAGNYAGALRSVGTLVIANTDFISNTAAAEDGAIYASGDATIGDSLIQGNSAGDYAGVMEVDGTLVVTNSRFIHNVAATYGGAVVANGDAQVSNSLFAGNQSGSGTGAALYVNGGTVALQHTTIASATLGNGSAIEVVAGTLDAANNIIAHYDTGISNSDTVNEDYNLFAGNITDLSGATAGTNSRSSANFSDAAFVDAAGGHFHLTSSRWALNKGTDVGVTADFDGDARPGGGGFDLGFDETTFSGPVANDDPNESTDEDVAVTLSPLVNDTDPETDTLTIDAVGVPAHGTATLSGTTQIVYTPTLNYVGTDVFTYTAREASQLSDTATITVTGGAVNDAPVITAPRPVSVTMSEDGSPTPFSLTLYATDAETDTLTWSIVTPAGHGAASASGTGGSKAIAYTPTLNFNGADTFTVAVSDGSLTDTATVSVTVTPVNDAPVAIGDTITTTEDLAVTISPLLNDTDVEGDTLNVVLVGSPAHGQSSIVNLQSQIIYTPTLNFVGTEVFLYSVSDGQLAGFGVITVTVEPVNDAPVITNTAPISITMSEDGSPTAFDLTLYATDAETDTLTWSIATQAGNGTASASGTGGSKAIGYTPTANWHGSDSFIVAVSDGSLTDTITVNVTVESVNDAPVAVDDRLLVRRDDTGDLFILASSSITIPVLLNDSDPVDGVNDSFGLTVSAVGAGSQGGAVDINPNNLWVDYTPAAAFTGTEIFTYTARDNGGLTATATVSVTVANGQGGGSTEPGDSVGQTIVIPNSGLSETITVTLQIPAGVATDPFTLVYDEPDTLSGELPSGFELAGLHFTLDAYLTQQLLPGYQFPPPITLTIAYSDADVAGISLGEESLELRLWNGSEWRTDGVAVISRDMDNNRLVLEISHLSEFALMGGDYRSYFFPIIYKSRGH